MTQETALIILAAAVGSGLLILAIAVFALAGGVKKIHLVIDDLRNIHHAGVEDGTRIREERLALDRKRFELDGRERKPRVLLLKSANLKLFEERQELTVGYSVEVMGGGRILITKLQVALVNKRSPNLIKILDMVFNRVVEPGKPLASDVVVSVKDFTRVSLPFVPDFGFIKDSCEIVASLEYEDRFGEAYRLDRDILEW
jgi:hypothetical protein